MDADLLIAMIAVPAHVTDAPDVSAGHRALDALTDTRDFRFESDDEVMWFLKPDDGSPDQAAAQVAELCDAHGELRRDLAQRAGHAILRQFEEALGGRDVGQFLIGGYKLYVTGGMSWGDEPTEAFTGFTNLDKLPAPVLAAMGVVDDPSRPPSRRVGLTGSLVTVPPTDPDIVDALALGLGTQDEWSSSDLEWIADTIGYVRPHPGSSDDPAAYLRRFTAETAFDPTRDRFLSRYVDEAASTADTHTDTHERTDTSDGQ